MLTGSSKQLFPTVIPGADLQITHGKNIQCYWYRVNNGTSGKGIVNPSTIKDALTEKKAYVLGN